MEKRNGTVLIFKILADTNRLKVLSLLIRARGARPVGGIAQELGMSHSATSHLLGTLHEAKVVTFEKHGREMHYALAKSRIARTIVRIVRAVR